MQVERIEGERERLHYMYKNVYKGIYVYIYMDVHHLYVTKKRKKHMYI